MSVGVYDDDDDDVLQCSNLQLSTMYKEEYLRDFKIKIKIPGLASILGRRRSHERACLFRFAARIS